MFDFDAPVERTGTDSMKWSRYAGREVIPLWVADMDFAAPPAVIAALQERVAHGVLGYNQPTPSQNEAVVSYLERHFRWTIDSDWIVWLPGLVTGLNVACRAVGDTGDAVFTSTPIYPPFLSSPTFSNRKTVTAPLVCDHGGDAPAWLWDFAAVDGVLKSSRAKLFLLCHPHNPTGRAWNDDELWQIAALAEKHNLVICSDEIHNGLVLDPASRHRPFATLSEDIAARTITLMAPSKTYNIPGLGSAFAIISDAGLRRNFRAATQGIVPHVNALGMAATEAALTSCDDWHKALLDYLRINARQVERTVASIDGLDMTSVEATYLAWIDARELARDRGIQHVAKHFEQHGLGFSDGTDFGAPGFVRLNFGTRRGLLDVALSRLRAAVAK